MLTTIISTHEFVVGFIASQQLQRIQPSIKESTLLALNHVNTKLTVFTGNPTASLQSSLITSIPVVVAFVPPLTPPSAPPPLVPLPLSFPFPLLPEPVPPPPLVPEKLD
jgi:hypothetical protein